MNQILPTLYLPVRRPNWASSKICASWGEGMSFRRSPSFPWTSRGARCLSSPAARHSYQLASMIARSLVRWCWKKVWAMSRCCPSKKTVTVQSKNWQNVARASMLISLRKKISLHNSKTQISSAIILRTTICQASQCLNQRRILCPCTQKPRIAWAHRAKPTIQNRDTGSP